MHRPDILLIATATISCCLIGVAAYRRNQLLQSGRLITGWNPLEEIFLMLVFPAAGEIFASFFLTRPLHVWCAGILLALFGVAGAWNRLRLRQQEAKEPEETAIPSRTNLLLLCFGMALLLAALFQWQWFHHWIPRFHHSP